MAYSFYGKNSRTFIKKGCTAEKILKAVKLNGGLSAEHCKSLGKRATFENALWSLYKRHYLKRFSFSTTEGFIYYLDPKKGFLYGLNRGLIHIYAKHISNKLIKNRGFWNQYKDVWLFSTKQIHEIYSKLNPSSDKEPLSR